MAETTDLAAWLTQIWDAQEKRERAKRAWGDRPAPAVAYHDGRVEIRWQSGMTQELTTAAFERVYVTPALDAEVLARIAADRQILSLHTGPHECPFWDSNGEFWEDLYCPTQFLLASAYADRAGFRESWRP